MTTTNRRGYSQNFMESLGKCRFCGGDKNYPMLMTAQNITGQSFICRAKFHTVRFRIATAIYKWITGVEPKQ